MQSLSTELDEMVLGYLDPLALSAVSMTSKYYRRIAEPHLYKNLVFYARDTYGFLNLLFSLLNRRELAQHIQSLTLLDYDDNKRIRGVGEAFHGDLWKFVPKIKRLIEDLCVDESFAFALRWLNAIITDGNYLYGALALILCLAHNLQHLSNLNHSHYIISNVLRKRWTHFDIQENGGSTDQTQTALAMGASKSTASERQAVHDRDKAKAHITGRMESSPKGTTWQDKAEEEHGSFPFGKLKTLSVYGQAYSDPSTIPFLPWLETLDIESGKRETDRDKFYCPYDSDNLDTQLQTLSISTFRRSPQWFQEVLEAPKFRNLKQLHIRGIYSMNSWWNQDAVQEFIDFLATRLPSLENFELYNHEFLEWIPAPLNFQRLANLRTVKVDARLLAPGEDDIPVYLKDSLTGFPACLETLILAKVMSGDLKRFVVDSTGPVEATNFANAVAPTALKKVEMYVRFRNEDCEDPEDPDELPTVLEEGIESFLRSLISSIAGVGVEMQVWCQKQTHRVKLLEGPQLSSAPTSMDTPASASGELSSYEQKAS